MLEALHLLKFGITKFCASCFPYPCATSFSYCHILIFPLQLFLLPFLPFFTVNFFSLSLPSTPLYFSPFVPPLLCPPYSSLLRLLFLLNPLLLLSFAVFSVASSFIFPYLFAAFSSSSNSICFCSSFLAGLRVDELQSGFESLWSGHASLLTASTPSLDPLSVLSISYPQTVPGRKSSRGVQLNGRLSRSAAGLNLHFAIASVTSFWDGCQLCRATNLHLPLAVFSSSSSRSPPCYCFSILLLLLDCFVFLIFLLHA